MGFIPRKIKRQLKDCRPVWLHAVSVGEVLASVPILKKIKKEHPEVNVVVSTITATGNYTVRQKIPEVDAVIYFPYDYFPIVQYVIGVVNPCIFIHTETEIWPNFLWVLHRRGIPSVIVNGRLSSQSSRRYKAFGWFFRDVFDKVAAYGVQSLVDYQRVIDMGVDPQRVLLTGNMKYDQDMPDVSGTEREQMIRNFHICPERKVFVAGSTHAGEEEIMLTVFENLLKKHPHLLLILAPRHPERFQEVEKLVKRHGLAMSRKTAIDRDEDRDSQAQVILLDTIGELSRVYSIGDVIFVGGSLVNIGGHNILEPVVFKKPVFFGPWMQNFSEITAAMREAGAGILVKTGEELEERADAFLSNEDEIRRLGEEGYAVIQRHQGATERNMKIINQFIAAQKEAAPASTICTAKPKP